MDIGSGLAILGVWLFAASCAMSKTVSAEGMVAGIIIAGIVTTVILLL